MTPFDSLHMISYYRPIVTLCLECTVFEILRHTGRQSPTKPTPPSFDALPSEPREYPHKPYFSRNCDLWRTFLLLIVWVYLHSYFRGGLRKTCVTKKTRNSRSRSVQGHPRSLILWYQSKALMRFPISVQ